MNKPLKIKNGILPAEMKGKELEQPPRCPYCKNTIRGVEIPGEDFVGFWTAVRVIERALNPLGPYDILEVPTPLGDFYFKANNWNAPMIVGYICKKCNVPALTLANWLKDWNRTPLDVYVES